jgi:hypothetical protein
MAAKLKHLRTSITILQKYSQYSHFPQPALFSLVSTFNVYFSRNFLMTKDRVHIFVYVTDGNIMYLTDASRFLISCVIQHYAAVVGWGGWRNRCIMLIMTLDPSWRQTLRLPPPGIESGSHRRALYLKSYLDSLYQCCGSGMFIPDPGSWFLAIPDPGSKTATKERVEKKFVVITFYVATNFKKIQIISVLNCWRTKFGPIFKEL